MYLKSQHDALAMQRERSIHLRQAMSDTFQKMQHSAPAGNDWKTQYASAAAQGYPHVAADRRQSYSTSGPTSLQIGGPLPSSTLDPSLLTLGHGYSPRRIKEQAQFPLTRERDRPRTAPAQRESRERRIPLEASLDADRWSGIGKSAYKWSWHGRNVLIEGPQISSHASRNAWTSPARQVSARKTTPPRANFDRKQDEHYRNPSPRTRADNAHSKEARTRHLAGEGRPKSMHGHAPTEVTGVEHRKHHASTSFRQADEVGLDKIEKALEEMRGRLGLHAEERRRRLDIVESIGDAEMPSFEAALARLKSRTSSLRQSSTLSSPASPLLHLMACISMGP